MQIWNDLHQIGSHFWIEALRHNFSGAALHCRWLLLSWVDVVLCWGKESRRTILFWCRVEIWMLCLLGEVAAGTSVLPSLFTQVLDGLGLRFKVQLQLGKVQCNLIFLFCFYDLHVIVGPWLFVNSWKVLVASASCICLLKLFLTSCLGFFLGYWVVDWVCCESVGAIRCILNSFVTAFVIVVIVFLQWLILMFLLAELAVQVAIECCLFWQSAFLPSKIVRQFVIGRAA